MTSPGSSGANSADAYVEILRRMTAADKLATARQLRELAWELTAAGIRVREPGLSEAAVQARVREVFLRAVT